MEIQLKTVCYQKLQQNFVFSIVVEKIRSYRSPAWFWPSSFLIIIIMIVGVKARNPFNYMMALGVGALMLMQVFVNIGGISGLIPSTGVTFPSFQRLGTRFW